MTAKIILLSDNSSFVDCVRTVLAHDGYQIVGVHSRWEALRAVADVEPDLIIVDIMMPHVEGWETCKYACAVSDVPVLFAFIESEECMSGVARGRLPGTKDPRRERGLAACDRCEKLKGQMEALLRSGQRSPVPVAACDLVLDQEQHTAIVEGQEITLAQTEFRLLACLAEQPGKVWSYDELLCSVWGEMCAGEKHYVQVYVSALRKKIEANPEQPRCILTKRGQGYYLAATK